MHLIGYLGHERKKTYSFELEIHSMLRWISSSLDGKLEYVPKSGSIWLKKNIQNIQTYKTQGSTKIMFFSVLSL